MNNIFTFGETVAEYDIKVLNEREVRAGAGILFALALVAFLNSWLVGNFVLTKIFVVGFLVDFAIRLFINPRYSPTLIAGRIFVRNQTVEYVGAPQKRFAWAIGFILASIMFYMVVINNIVGPANLLVCLLCLTLLFFESAFGICIGCIIYNMFNKEKAKLCPGNVCTPSERVAIQKFGIEQFVILASFIFFVIFVSSSPLINGVQTTAASTSTSTENSNSSSEACVAPQWAIDIGHEEQWKLHNNCP
jgi:hypothetical protein